MGFIKRILVGFFTLLGVIIGSVAGALGLGKSEYFMEMGETDPDTTPAQVEAAKSTPNEPPSNAAAVKAEQTQRPSTPPPAVSTPGSAAPKPTPDIISPPKGEAQSIQTPAQPRTSEPSPSSVMVASSAASDASSKAEPTESFAANHLLNRSTTGGRRRPGPSLNPFKDMAKEVGKS